MLTVPRIATAVCVAALVLSACGAGDDPADEVAASEPAEVEAEPGEPTEDESTDDASDRDAADDASSEPDEQPDPEPCPPGTQAVVPGAECNPIPEPQPEPEPEPEPEPQPTPDAEPAPTQAPQPASNPCDERGPQSLTTSVGDFFFDPADRGDLCVGDQITFTNVGEISHTATNRGGAFDTGTLTAGQSATVTIGQTGEIRYVCLFHSQMSGTLNVVG